ncbi:hypothetical protein [Candidatus Nitrotoga arctica]|uniref:hypothetical protein n=1 Tax=Candidatus Nitrotoga arctica TaxID=453162 RepID=UPI001EFBEC42|nr:hypothetical protein [Candidatus Nitrotoga arctica]
MQLVILAHALDAGAQAVASVLAPILDHRLMVLRPEWLGQAFWSQRLDEQGRARTLLQWHGDRRLEGNQIGFVWNRIRLLPQAAFRASTTQDRDYAAAELHALVASWLAELGERAEPPMCRHGSVIPALHHLHWVAVARQCGFALATGPSAPEDFAVLRTPIELWGSVKSNWPAPFVRACHGMAEKLGFALLSLGFRGTPTAPLLCSVDAQPALSSLGEVRAVARWVTHRVNAVASPNARAAAEALT